MLNPFTGIYFPFLAHYQEDEATHFVINLSVSLPGKIHQLIDSSWQTRRKKSLPSIKKQAGGL
jgi:hypothetical protein